MIHKMRREEWESTKQELAVVREQLVEKGLLTDPVETEELRDRFEVERNPVAAALCLQRIAGGIDDSPEIRMHVVSLANRLLEYPVVER